MVVAADGSDRMIHSDQSNPADLLREVRRLRQENATLHRYEELARPILAMLALNPFAEVDELRSDARAALSFARGRAAGAGSTSSGSRRVVR